MKTENYKTVKLSDICTLEKGAQIDTSSLDDSNLYRYINGGIKESGYYFDFNTQGESVLISEGGASCGYINYVNEKFWCGCHCYRLHDIKIFPKYLFHALKANQPRVMNLRTGSAMPNIQKSKIQNFKLNIQENPETQKHIAAVLDKCTALIAKHKAMLEKYDTLVKSRFIEMFGENSTENGKWKIEKLGNIGTCKNGMNFSYDENGIQISALGVSDFKDNSIVDCSALPKISLNEPPSEEYLLQDEDIIFVRSNGNKELVGRSVIVYPKNPTTFSGFCIRYRKNYDNLNSIFLLRYLKTNYARKKMAGRGANIQNLNQQILSELQIPVPPLPLQEQFATFVRHIAKSKFVVKKSLEKCDILYKALMQEYFL